MRSLPVDEAAGETESKMRVGIMTYDNKINFYNCNKNLAQPQQMTVGDVDDMFVPLVEGEAAVAIFKKIILISFHSCCRFASVGQGV